MYIPINILSSDDNEILAGVYRSDGREEQFYIHPRCIEVKGNQSFVDIGFPVGLKNENYLIELPNESVYGNWRIEVPKGDVI